MLMIDIANALTFRFPSWI